MEDRCHAESALQLDQIHLVEEQNFKELAFVMGFCGQEKYPTLMVTQQELHYHPPFRYTSRTHLVFKGNEYAVNVLGFLLQSGPVSTATEVHELCKMFSSQSAYKFCPGIEYNIYEEQYHSVIRYHLKSVRYCAAPFQHVDSVNCMLWYQLPMNAPLVDKHVKEVLCSSCKRLKSDLDWQRKRTMCENPSRKLKWQASSSKAKLSYMSPSSQAKRKQNILTERGNDKKKLAKYENTEVTLADGQHEEMPTLVNKIKEVGKAELEKIFAEGDSHGVGTQVREIWMTNKRQQLSQFKDQEK